MKDPARTGGEHGLALQFERFRIDLVGRMFGAALVLVLLYAPVLAWRVHEVGWHAQLVVHAGWMLLGLVCFAVRARLPMRVKSAFVVGAPFLLGLTGMFNQGMMGPGYWWTLIAVVLAATLYSMRVGAVLAVAAATLLLLAAFGFSSGRLMPPVDLNAFSKSASAWVGFIVVAIIAPLSLLYAVGNYQSMTTRFAHEIEAQRKQLAAMLGHDQLTGLPQSALAMDRLERQLAGARRSGRKAALLFIDLDGFKLVNDSQGHAAGDRLLTTIAQRLRSLLRETDTVARVGGDEFLVILGELQQGEMAAQVAEKVVAQIAGPIPWNEHELQVSASVGIALFPDHALDAESLRRAADAAMYEAKRQGRNRYRHAPAPGPRQSA